MSDSTITWGKWINDNFFDSLIELDWEQEGQKWKPTDEDKSAAWVIYTELHSRITTQQLHYRSGDEETALTSIFNLFQIIRDVIKKEGNTCQHFAALALYTLNIHIRPFTAKWHRKKIVNEFANDDVRRSFRNELGRLQKKLRIFSKLMECIALGKNNITPPMENDFNNYEVIKNQNDFKSLIPFEPIIFSNSKASCTKEYTP